MKLWMSVALFCPRKGTERELLRRNQMFIHIQLPLFFFFFSDSVFGQ